MTTPPPSSRRPAGIPDSNSNAKYLGIAVLLLCAMGGLFAWRSMSNKAQTAPAPLPTLAGPTLAPTNPKLEDIPLPPPPEEKPDAARGPRIVYVPASGGCSGKCAGTAPPELGQALQVRAAQARRCYNQALTQDSSLRGHVTLSVRIGPSGNVCSANVASNDMGSAGVANCAANMFRTGSGYPSPRGGCVDATVPLSFVPQGQ